MTTLIANAVGSHCSIEAFIKKSCDLSLLTLDQERQLLVRYQESQDVEAAQELVLRNMRMVLHVAKKFFTFSLPREDIVQQGAIGLMMAIKRFDLNRTVRFAGYAKYWIKAEILEYILRNWRIVKIATTKAQRKLFFNYRKLRRLAGELTDVQALKISEELSVPVTAVKIMYERMSANDEAIDRDTCFLELGNTEEDNPMVLLEIAQQNSLNSDVYDAVDDLNDRERDIIKQRFFREKPATLAELALRYQVSIERIRQLEVKAIKQLKMSLVA